MTGIVTLLVVLAAATAVGLAWHRSNGRMRELAEPSGGAVVHSLGLDRGVVTLVQFSSQLCQPCRSTHRLLADVAATIPGVRHVELDVDHHLDAVRALDVRRTPTVFVVDRSGRIVWRATGQPAREDVRAAVQPLVAA